ncbi:hypothetical protein Droror1_Dr00006906 [Drosera rotundifolia]
MDNEESILGWIHEEYGIEDVSDVEMLDVEDGEVFDEESSRIKHGENGEGHVKEVKSVPLNRNQKRRQNKKKKKNRANSGSSVTDINRYVLDVCRRLKEKKTYLVYNAVGCLGVSALSELVKEVEAIQACGGQKTADGYRFRTGGGILWNILKTREPNAHKEIMKKGKEFEKQFRRSNIMQAYGKNKDNSAESAPSVTNQTPDKNLDCLQPISPSNGQPEQLNSLGKQLLLEGRLRRPVSYDDLLTEEPEAAVGNLAR